MQSQWFQTFWFWTRLWMVNFYLNSQRHLLKKHDRRSANWIFQTLKLRKNNSDIWLTRLLHFILIFWFARITAKILISQQITAFSDTNSISSPQVVMDELTRLQTTKFASIAIDCYEEFGKFIDIIYRN